MRWLTVIKVALAAFLLATVLQLGWFIYLWLSGSSFGLWHWIWLGIVSVLALVVLALTIIYRKRIWPHDPAAAELRALRQQVKRQFGQARSRARVIRRRADAVPWNIFIAHRSDAPSTAMAELGYVAFGEPVSHKGLTTTTWTSPTAIAFKVEIDGGAELSLDLLNLVFKKLFKNRPTLAVNAAYVEIELAMLLQTPAVQAGNISTINRILNVAAYEFGIDIPIHVALVGLEQVQDLSRAALLTGHLNKGVVFGGFLPDVDGGVDERVNALFAEIIANLGRGQMPALQKQLLPEFSASLLNAPLQLALINAQLRPRMAALVQPFPPRTEPLNLQSIVFVGAHETMPVVDPLAQVTGQRFFSQMPVSADLDDDHTSVTVENAGLLARAYHGESFQVRPNRRQTAQRGLKSSLWTAGLTALVGGFAYLVWENYSSYRAVNDNLEAAFDTYFSEVSNISTDSDFLVQRTLLLQPLRDGLARYAPLNEQNHRELLPDWSMEEMYRGLYERELVEGYQASLIDFMEKEIFAFNSLGDGVELIQLATVEAQLHTDQVAHKEALITYYSDGLAEQGEVSGAFQNSLKGTLDDLFTLNQPRPNRNESLRTVVANTLAGLDTADLFYQALMRRPEYSERIDLRRLVGPRFSEVFVEIEDPEDYLVPRAYTRPGFDDLFVDGEMADLNDILRGYESVIGELDTAAENAITRRVAQNYTGDYIERWGRFIMALELRAAEDWSDAQILLAALTNASENPINQLVSAITTNTDIQVFLPAPPVAAQAAGGDQGEMAEAAPELAPPTSSTEAATAFNIRSAFRAYLDALQPGQDQQSTFDLFLSYARDVNLWMAEATNAPNGPGAYLFTQFQNPGAPNPLAVLNSFVTRSDLDFIRDFGRSIVATLDDSAMEFVRGHIDSEWERQILVPHQATLTQTFPFDPASATDFPLAEFTDLFGAEGKIGKFEQDFLSGFKAANGQFAPRNTFLLAGRVDLTNETKVAFTRFNQISEAMFVDGKPFMEFNVRTGFMDNELSRLSLSSGITLHQFSHGPVRWDTQSWPLTGIQDSTIAFRIFRRARALVDETYPGPWSWFRLVQAGSASLNPSLGVTEATFTTEGDAATLQFDAAVRYNPFAPGFFSDVSIPRSLFTLPEPEVDIEEEEPSTADALLTSWRQREPEATQQLITLRGRQLDPSTRVEIQRILADTGFYEEDLDGIFGPATRAALFAWRQDAEQN
ncbi:ImcF-related family protein [Cognatiyoonia sp. IB215182]|uniref:ImcF-related family protein n=1 Tax=Cognatiyoonia sp. IB215182 TaxID=3097353 RepID=UPI002A0D9694|nr:ImcF-related family protein [Cognatiyoonia sp. IB215182]MDX8355183.1 ImcF-related family protein [Cognatiyoonia sp. IB215182]